MHVIVQFTPLCASTYSLSSREECQRRGIIENEEIVWNGKERIFYIRAHNGV